MEHRRTRAPAQVLYPPTRTAPGWRRENCGYRDNPCYIATQQEERARRECPLHTAPPLKADRSSSERWPLRRRDFESTPEAAGDRNPLPGIEIGPAKRRYLRCPGELESP